MQVGLSCRQRVQKAMLDDEIRSNRVKDARAREDAYLEQRVREADVMARPEVHRRSTPPESVQDGPIAEPQEVVEQQPMS